MTITTTDDDLRRTWENQQSVHKRDRELRFQLMLDHVEHLAGVPRRVLDLACGPGSVTKRVLDRFPTATVVALDIDPLLLHLAAGAFATDSRVEIVSRNLNDPDWAGGLSAGFDAVLTTTAMHWLSAEALGRVYEGAAGLLKPGGVFANADWMMLADPRLRTVADELHHKHLDQVFATGAESCDEWYYRAYGLTPYKSMLDEAAEAGLRLVHHAGETAGPASIREAIGIGRAERIGHGITVLSDPELVAELRSRQLPLEVCPSSNVALGIVASYAGHPLPQLLDAGLAVTVSTDIPNVLGPITLSAEFARIRDTFGLDDPALAALNHTAIEASFAPAETKARLHTATDTWLAARPATT